MPHHLAMPDQSTPRFTEAIAFAQSHEIAWPRDPAADPEHWGVHHSDPPPFNRLRGPVHERGGVSGVIRIKGEEVAAWGEPDRADQTFSVAKSYLTLLAGIAHARGLLDPRERLSVRLPGIGFDSPHNRAITWEHLLTQTSEWEGECFGMPDQVEHNRVVPHDPKPPEGKKGERRTLRDPGTYWEYNDVRINQLALALLHIFKRPLPEVFVENVLRPIGGGRDFRWEGYDDAWVEIDGRRMQSVTGGTHWGAGV
jgi:CubicO group peptidase (beta-lactamase class C family)